MRKTLVITLAALLTLALAASAAVAGLTLTLDSAQPVAEQAAALAGYILQLPEEDQAEWLGEMSAMVGSEGALYAASFLSADGGTVYVTKSGSKYHRDSSCSGLSSAKEILPVARADVKAKGKTPCKLCYPGGDK